MQNVIYRSDTSRARFAAAVQEAKPDECLRDHWRPVAELFQERRPQARRIDTPLAWLLSVTDQDGRPRSFRPMLVINLSKEKARDLFWNDKI